MTTPPPRCPTEEVLLVRTGAPVLTGASSFGGPTPSASPSASAARRGVHGDRHGDGDRRRTGEQLVHPLVEALGDLTQPVVQAAARGTRPIAARVARRPSLRAVPAVVVAMGQGGPPGRSASIDTETCSAILRDLPEKIRLAPSATARSPWPCSSPSRSGSPSPRPPRARSASSGRSRSARPWQTRPR